MWDVRSSVALGVLEEHGDKVLCVGWLDEERLASGGADCKLQVYALPDTVSNVDDA